MIELDIAELAGKTIEGVKVKTRDGYGGDSLEYILGLTLSDGSLLQVLADYDGCSGSPCLEVVHWGNQ